MIMVLLYLLIGVILTIVSTSIAIAMNLENIRQEIKEINDLGPADSTVCYILIFLTIVMGWPILLIKSIRKHT